MTEVWRQVEAAARATPEALAVEDGGRQYSFRALVEAADRMARGFVARGVRAETLVGLCLPRSWERIVANLGVWKAGGAVLFLDPDWPERRLLQCLEACGVLLVVTREGLAAGPIRACVTVEEVARVDTPDFRSGLEPVRHKDDLAYVVCTSGSTGEPKGVEITDGNLEHLISWHREAFGLDRTDRMGHIAGLGFDAAVWEIWPALCTGAAIVLADDETRTSPQQLQDWLTDRGITVAFVPTVLAEKLIVAEWAIRPTLRLLLTGGDILHRRPSRSLSFAVVNNYGPSECTVVATSGVVAAGEDGPPPDIGHPISRMQVRVVDAVGREVSDGTDGEIAIAGAGVGRGYRNRPDLTRQRFRPQLSSAGPMYMTGDRGRRLPDGRIVFLGRFDEQEKIRGVRVEPNEVATALAAHPHVAWCFVTGHGAADARCLVAYVVPAGEPPSAEALRDFLRQRLPEHAIPAAFLRLDAIPVSASGKFDRAALPPDRPEHRLPVTTFRAPRTPAETRVAAIVAGLMHRDGVGVDDNFFLLGGQSLLGAQVILRIREAFGVQLSLRDLFEAQTIARIARRVADRLEESVRAMSDAEAERRLAS